MYIYRLVAEGFEKRVHARAAQKNFLALRVVDDKAFERMYNGDELGNAMRLEEGPMRVDSASDDEEEEVVAGAAGAAGRRGLGGGPRKAVVHGRVGHRDGYVACWK